MRTFLIGFMLACLLVTQANAESRSEKYSRCVAMASFAKAAMSARQEGVSIIDLIKVTETDDALANEYIRVIIEVAYDSPRYNSEYYKQKKITEYEAAAYLSCMNELQWLK